jgi:tetratricopeptide (TPR) repeat protein
MTQVDAIFIFCGDKSRHEGWVKTWPKVKGLYTHIKPICAALQLAVKQFNQDSTPLSFAQVSGEDASEINLNQLEPSFMYTQLFKKTLLDMEHDRKTAVQDLVKYCQETYAGNPAQLALIDEFHRTYQQKRAIWWYTREGFTYQMLNRALRLLEAHIIVNMGFFIHDLHQQIQQLHKEQLGEYGGQPFVVYRGQGLSNGDFEKLKRSRGGLMSFNCFVSTSTEIERSMEFARTAAMDPDRVGILFVMTIDPNISATPFADIKEVSYYEYEAEILFSMHTVFRIDTIEQMDNKEGHVQVNLILTDDRDTQLNDVMKQLDGDVGSSSRWERMGRLLLKVGQPEKAEELYHTLLEQSSDRGDQGRYYHGLGEIKYQQGDYQEALSFYERALEIFEKSHPANHPSLASSYNNIGLVYTDMGEYSKALSSHERALEVRQKSLPPNHPSLATHYNNIGLVYKDMGEYSKALSFYERALEIFEKSHPANHPSLASSYNNIGLVYDHIGEYSKALSFCERALEIRQKSLPPNHPSLAQSYNSIGLVYTNMGEFSKALSFYEKDLEISKKSLPDNHPDLATSYNNIGRVYDHMGEYSKALSFFERALEIWKKSLPTNHPSLASSYNNIGMVYYNMGEYSKALSSHERALEIRQKSLPGNHSDLASSYNKIGLVYYNMGEYSKALSFCERALEIPQESLLDNHHELAASYNNIGMVYYNMGEYSKALSFFERALEIWKKSLLANHPSLSSVRESIEIVKMKLNKK